RLIDGAKIEVILPNNRDKAYKAEIIGRDEKTDIAVLKIDATGLPAAEMGDSDKVRTGQLAVAIGNPGGMNYMGSVTAGVISGINRTIVMDNGQEFKLIQTDAAINPGNSGGALVNSQGQVIGINTIKISATDVEGLGFAIPINEANEIAESLINYRYVKDRPYLGVVIDNSFTKEDAERLKVPVGLLVYDVQPLTAAYKAGIHIGDIIVKFDGKETTTFKELEDQKNLHKPGDEVIVEVYRDGEILSLKVILGEEKKID
ncbi:MAG TPA: trypsin-like peptidase domain-containing protein, partial [Clostridiales bacterium]|nr:trypsin-like peptidase domain-containing protein [Clostridiales bacterium]